MRLFLGIVLCGLLPGIAMARGGVGVGFHGGVHGGFRGGHGAFHARFGSFQNQTGGFGFIQPFGFGYVGGGFPDYYGGAEAASDSYPAPSYISIAGPYISIASPYIGNVGPPDEEYSPGQGDIGYGPWDPGEFPPLLAGPYGTLPLRPSGNPGFNQPVHAVSGAAAPSIDEGQSRVLVWIALKDHLVDTAVAYWVQEKDLHYIKTDGSQRQVPLASVDRQTSARLNARGPGKLVLP